MTELLAELDILKERYSYAQDELARIAIAKANIMNMLKEQADE